MINLKPGSHYFVLTDSVDSEALKRRKEGLEIRDCFSIQTPSGPIFGLLFRVPLGDTVLEQTLREGVGTLDIDVGRISYISQKDEDQAIKPQPEFNTTGKVYNFKTGVGRNGDYYDPSTGRYPSNLLLIHGSNCECIGTREIKTRTDTRPEEDAGRTSKQQWRFTPTSETRRGYGGKDGTEEVIDWDCQPNCPVRLLDLQSGVLHARGNITETKQSNAFWGNCAGENSYQVFSAEEGGGGASRFFYQTTSLEEVASYLNNLTRSS